jgi:DNA-binding CsgD family transcriptional regulator
VFLLSYMVMGLLLGASTRRVAALDGKLGVTLPLALFLGVGMLIISTYQGLFSVSLFASLGSLIMGVAQIWITSSVKCLAFTRLSLQGIVVVYALSNVTSNVLYSAILTLGNEQQQIRVALIIPLLVIASFSFCQYLLRRNPAVEPPPPGAHWQNPFVTYRTQIGSLVAIIVTTVALRGVSQGGIWGDSVYVMDGADFTSLIISAGAGLSFLIIALPVFLYHTRQSSQLSLLFPFLVLVALMLALAITRSSPVFPWFSSLVERYCQTLLALTTAIAVKVFPAHPYRVIGFTLASTYLLALIWIAFIEGLSFEIHLIILVLAYLSVIAIVLIKVERTSGLTSLSDTETTTPSPVDEVLKAKSLVLAQQYALTQRETEILILLAKGRSVPYIQEQLFLAHGTVKTHTKHIYRKLEIHTRQELLTLFERSSEGEQPSK